MRNLSLVLSALVVLAACASCAQNDEGKSDGKSGAPVAAGAAGAPHHQMFRPDQVPWRDGPPSLPPGAQFAILEGDPAKPGYFAMRLKLPDGFKVPPHTHPNVERVTIIAGTLHLGTGPTFNKSAGVHALPAGSYSTMQPGMQHFAWAEGETILQLATMGPWQINYVNPADDPRKK
jgi:quercetin dioxygenase-like cupin family protein